MLFQRWRDVEIKGYHHPRLNQFSILCIIAEKKGGGYRNKEIKEILFTSGEINPGFRD